MIHSLDRDLAVRNPYVQNIPWSYLSTSQPPFRLNEHIERTLLSSDYS